MSRISEEKYLIALMILQYCTKKHGGKELCDECAELKAYAYQRLENCRYGENKSACSKCATHCYAPSHRVRIRQVMRFAGPRMMLYHPILVLRHMLRW